MNLCFVAHFAFRALTGRGHGHIGGVERQTALMAKWLAARGHSVAVIVWDEGQADEIEVDGVRIIKVCPQDTGFPGLRFFTPRWTSLARAMRHADADIYYHNCAEYVTGQVALWARRHKRTFVYSVASDPGCDPTFPTLKSFRERYLYRYGLMQADLVICQTEYQRDCLRNGFGISAIRLPMPSTAADIAMTPSISTRIPKVLWIGRLDPVKRPELIIDVARKCKELEFIVVGPIGSDRAYAESLLARSKELENISWIGGVNFLDVGDYFDQCAALLCTSKFEGFPNTFLEAWSRGVPVVSTIDPDNLIESNEMGSAAHDVDELAVSLIDLFASRDKLETQSKNALAYFSKYHDANQAMVRFEREFLSLLPD